MNKNILIVEDDDSFAAIIKEHLEERNINCIIVKKAEDAFKYVEMADSIIIDLCLPGIGGKELIRQIRSKNDFTPVIVMSGCGKYEKDLETSIIDFISKNNPLEIFFNHLDKALNLAEKINYLDDATVRIKSFIARQACH